MPLHQRYLKGVLCILICVHRGQAARCAGTAYSLAELKTILFSNLTYFSPLFFFFLSEVGALLEPALSAISELFVGV